jgi:hypothetical protein
MNDGSIKAVLEMTIPRLIKLVTERNAVSEQDAFAQIYSSELYAQLEREETKLWHLSVPALYELFTEEQHTGAITYPEEA